MLEQVAAAAERTEQAEEKREEAARRESDPLQVVSRELNLQLAVSLAHDAGIPLARPFADGTPRE